MSALHAHAITAANAPVIVGWSLVALVIAVTVAAVAMAYDRRPERGEQ